MLALADPSRRSETWAWHPEWDLGGPGIQILARDVDGDGLSDLVDGVGHDYGLSWMKQGKSASGERTWTKEAIDQGVASVHTLLWADLDGDGKAHELITGKRVYAHEVEPGATDGSLIAWCQFDPRAKRWIKHVIFQGEPARNPSRRPRSVSPSRPSPPALPAPAFR